MTEVILQVCETVSKKEVNIFIDKHIPSYINLKADLKYIFVSVKAAFCLLVIPSSFSNRIVKPECFGFCLGFGLFFFSKFSFLI